MAWENSLNDPRELCLQYTHQPLLYIRTKVVLRWKIEWQKNGKESFELWKVPPSSNLKGVSLSSCCLYIWKKRVKGGLLSQQMILDTSFTDVASPLKSISTHFQLQWKIENWKLFCYIFSLPWGEPNSAHPFFLISDTYWLAPIFCWRAKLNFQNQFPISAFWLISLVDGWKHVKIRYVASWKELCKKTTLNSITKDGFPTLYQEYSHTTRKSRTAS